MDFMILAYQRTGTGVLTDLLNTHPDILALREVFHPDETGRDSFFEFFARHPIEAGARTRLDTRRAVFAAYLDHLAQSFGRGHVGVNVKYASSHQLDGDWADPLARPQLFDTMAGRGGAVIHLLRRDVFLQALSLLRAGRTGVWHLRPGEPRLDARITVDPAALLDLMRQIEAQTRLFRQILSTDRRVLTVQYEDMLKNGRFMPAFTGALAGFLGVPDRFDPVARQLRIAPADWRQSVENWREVEAHVSGHGMTVAA